MVDTLIAYKPHSLLDFRDAGSCKHGAQSWNSRHMPGGVIAAAASAVAASRCRRSDLMNAAAASGGWEPLQRKDKLKMSLAGWFDLAKHLECSHVPCLSIPRRLF